MPLDRSTRFRVREFHSPPVRHVDVPVQLLYSLAAVKPLPLQILQFVDRCPLRLHDLLLRCKRQNRAPQLIALVQVTFLCCSLANSSDTSSTGCRKISSA